MKLPERDPGTTVNQTLLANAAAAAAVTAGVLPTDNDYYLQIVATAVDQPLATVKEKYIAGDRGIITARLSVKHLIQERAFPRTPPSP